MEWFTKQIEQLKPHAARIGVRAESYAERIIARLDAIHDALDTDDPDTAYRTARYTVMPGQDVDAFTVPPNQTWELTAFNLAPNVPGTAATVHLLDDYQFVGGVSGGTPTSGPGGLFFRGGSIITLRGITDTALVYLQLKVTLKKPAKLTQAAGMMEWSAMDGVPDARQSAQNESRHATPGLVAVPNPVGEAANTGL